ncbi:MAG: CARDB domain-containing protein [Chrysiogenia bacterium]
MKKTIIMVMVLLLILAGLPAADEISRVLAMEIPGDEESAKNILWVNLGQLQELSSELAAAVPAADIALLDRQDRILANFGSIRKGKCKWAQKIVRAKFLAVNFAAAEYSQLASGIRSRDAMPGFQLAALDPKMKTVIQSIPVVFWDMADLVVQLNYPVNAEPGQSLGREVTVELENRGSIAASAIQLDIILCRDSHFQFSGAATTSGDVPQGIGRETIPMLEAGQRITVQFSGDLKIPDDTMPGKQYLAVVADADGRIVELSKENNIHSGFIMITVPEPKAFVMALPETVLHFEPANYGFRIVAHEAILSDGKDWKLCKMKPNIYQIKHASWSDFFWEIDTYEKAVWEIKGVDFCRKGGKSRELGIKVNVEGGSLLIPPSRFTLKLSSSQLRFEPGSKKLTLSAFDKPIFHMPFWWVCRRESYLYQVRFALWENYFWQIDTFKKQASSISGGKFCSGEGRREPLSAPITVEK